MGELSDTIYQGAATHSVGTHTFACVACSGVRHELLQARNDARNGEANDHDIEG